MRRLVLPLFALLLLAPFASARIAGGFKMVPANDPAAVKAAEFAVQAASAKEKKAVLLKKLKMAELQIVAGVNYRLTMDVTVDGVESPAQATVWRKLDKTMELTRWSLIKQEK